MTLTIRPARPGEEALLARLHGAALSGAAWDAAYWGRALEDDQQLVMLAEAPNAVGLSAARLVAGEAEILTIGITEDARGRGYGRALLSRTLEHIGLKGGTRCFLEVEDSNRAALGLYEKSGFVTVGRRENYYGPGRRALVMERQNCLPRGDADS